MRRFSEIWRWFCNKLEWIAAGMCFFLGVLAMYIVLLIAARIEPAVARFLELIP